MTHDHVGEFSIDCVICLRERIAELEKVCIDSLGVLVAGDVQAARFYLRKVAESVYSREEPKP